MDKIVFFSVIHRFDDTRIVHKEARVLAEAGYSVSHLCPATGKDEPPFPPEGLQIGGVGITFYGKGRGGVLGGLNRYVGGFFAALQKNADYYHCNEPESWILGCLIKIIRLGKTKVLFDVHEHYPSRFDEPHVSPLKRFFGRPLLRLAFALLPRMTDHIILAKHSVSDDFDHVREKTTFVFNYVPRFALDLPPVQEDPLAQLKSDADLILIHVGAFSRWRGWPQILDALAKAQNQRVHLVGLGRVAEGPEVLLERAGELGLEQRVHIIASVPYDEMFDYLRCADVGLMLYQPGILNHVYAFPMKLYDYMAAEIPVIGPDFAVEVTPVIDETHCGILLDTSDSQALAGAIDHLAGNPEERAEMGRRGREGVETRYVWEREGDKLLEVYRNLGGMH